MKTAGRTGWNCTHRTGDGPFCLAVPRPLPLSLSLRQAPAGVQRVSRPRRTSSQVDVGSNPGRQRHTSLGGASVDSRTQPNSRPRRNSLTPQNSMPRWNPSTRQNTMAPASVPAKPPRRSSQPLTPANPPLRHPRQSLHRASSWAPREASAQPVSSENEVPGHLLTCLPSPDPTLP